MKRKTKIVCTVGPAIDNEEMLEKMFLAGMDVARLNFSHANYDEHGARIKMIRKVADKVGKYIGIMADTKVLKLELEFLKMVKFSLIKVMKQL